MIKHSLMVHEQVLEAYIHFMLMYTECHIFAVIPIKDLINEDGDPTMPFTLAIGTKPSLLHLRVLFFPCVVQKATAHVGTKVVNMHHRSQKCFRGIFIGIPQHQRGYLVYVPQKCKIVSSYDSIIDDNLCSALTYKSQPYS